MTAQQLLLWGDRPDVHLEFVDLDHGSRAQNSLSVWSIQLLIERKDDQCGIICLLDLMITNAECIAVDSDVYCFTIAISFVLVHPLTAVALAGNIQLSVLLVVMALTELALLLAFVLIWQSCIALWSVFCIIEYRLTGINKYSHTHTHTHTQTDRQTYTHTHIHMYSTLTHTHTCAHTHSHSLAHSHTHTHTASLGMLWRNLRFCPEICRKTACTSLVRSLLEYSFTVWDPHVQKEIYQIEGIQRRAARYISSEITNPETQAVSQLCSRS